MASRTDTPTPRAEALSLLLRIEQDGAYGDRILSTGISEDYDARDKAFIRELVLGVLRWQLRLDRVIDMYYTNRPDRMHVEVRMVLRLGLVQLMFMDTIPDWAAVNESVALARTVRKGAAAGLVNAVLRRFLREGEPSSSDDNPADRLAVTYSHPVWLVRRWIEAYGEDTTERMLAAGIKKHPVTIRTNTLRTSSGDLSGTLAGEGYATEPVESLPSYLLVAEAGGLFAGRSFNNGLFTAQDPSAGMAVLLMDPQPGDRLLDLCAAPGGKTTHLAELSDDRAVIDAVDVNEMRLGLVAQAAARLGIRSIRCVPGDATSFVPADKEKYDRILCDVPCSGTAVLSKRPDMKWRRTEADIMRMAALQKRILANAANLLKPGGIIVYSTCTMEHEENEDIIGWFTDTFPFHIEKDDRFKAYETAEGYRIFPHLIGSAGAFAVKLRHTVNE